MTDRVPTREEVLGSVWQQLAGQPLDAVPVLLTGPEHVLPSAFRVTTAAVVSVAAATAAAARLAAAPGSPVPGAVVDAQEAAVAFQAERHLRIDGAVPPLWDPLAGDYRTADGWVRLHTNYRHHRHAALRALGLSPDAERTEVAALLSSARSVEVEDAVYAGGGVAAALRSREEWQAHPQRDAVGSRPLVAVDRHGDGGAAERRAPRRPRVLDLTRVIAGPTATKVLAAHGADVLRLDAPGFEEVPVLVADATAGKRTAALDLRTPDGRTGFAELVRDADVLVDGLRPGALEALGWDRSRLWETRPGLVVAELSAYGRTGPWGDRRGFDSLVQMVTGIADEGARRAGSEQPVPLPAQVLDHASGWLLAAGVLEALHRRREQGGSWSVEVVLARTAEWLDSLGRDETGTLAPATDPDLEGLLEVVDADLGRVTRVRCPGTVDGRRVPWGGPPRRLGSQPPSWG